MPPQPIYLKDYRPSDYLVDTVDLHFDLSEETTRVSSRLLCRRRETDQSEIPPLVLNGQDLDLVSVSMDGRHLKSEEYLIEPEILTIFQPGASFTLEIVTRIHPATNTALEGLYLSSGNFCTQCEAEGFRRITYFLDRPDVMATYTVMIVASRNYPVLLSNGNQVASGNLEGDLHFAKWHDPFPKPCYLFALVAGDLRCLEDRFVTASGRQVLLQIYVQPHNLDKCAHAMASLQKAMRWDEEVFGLEYDLDQYMIVAVDDFNMGAMENKGLNIFNSSCVLASSATATDGDYERIEAVIAHEYFHNWTGNRVTCRDWFQLSLKEGLTVFRDQEFTADMTSRPVKRIHDVSLLKDHQFPEDAGPMAHPVRPDSYIEINNFYTITIYEKGAELIRMIHTLIGPELFRQGLRLYLSRHDGKAVTTDDFVQAMEEAGQIDLSRFRLWYSQAGTPRLMVSDSFSEKDGIYSLTIRQDSPPTPGQPEKKPLPIPLALGLLEQNGTALPLQLLGEKKPTAGTTRILELRQAEQTFCFVNLHHKPLPSLLRNFSAPVNLNYPYSDQELRLLLRHDSDLFNRWDAGQRLGLGMLQGLATDFRQQRPLTLETDFIEVFASLLADDDLDRTFLALLLTLPSETYLADTMEVIDVEAIHAARQFVRLTLARQLRPSFLRLYRQADDGQVYRYEQQAAGRRALKNMCLSYLMMLDDPEIMSLCTAQFYRTDNMTDCIAALRCLAHTAGTQRQEVLAAFYEKWRHDPLVLDKWFAVQATAPLDSTLDEVKKLLQHPSFSIKTPNKVRALIGAFCGANQVCFHRRDGEAYIFLTDQVLELDRLNPQMAARLLGNFSRWRKFDSGRQGQILRVLTKILDAATLSRDVYEVALKIKTGNS